MRFLNLLLLLSATAVLADGAVDKPGSDDAQLSQETTHNSAHESVHESIYETIDEAHIGRVFLTREERRWLDEARARPAGSSGERQAVAVESPRQDAGAAGFIRVPGKAPQVFRRGRFVPTDSSSTVGEPLVDRRSGIVIQRHEASEAAERNKTTEARGP